jgi:WD40 repeat protein
VVTTALPVVQTPTPGATAASQPTDCPPSRCKTVAQYTAAFSVATVGFDRTGQKLLAASFEEPTVYVWPDVATSATSVGYSPQRGQAGGPITAAIWDPVGGAWPCRVATGWGDGYVTFWDDLQRVINWSSPSGQAGPIRSIAFDWRGMYVASGSDDGTVAVWAPGATDPLLGMLPTANGVTRTLAWKPSGTDEALAPSGGSACAMRGSDRPPADLQVLAGGTDSGAIILWDPSQAWTPTVLHRHTAAVRSLAWSPDGRYLASSADDQLVLVWDRARGATVPTELLSSTSSAGPVRSVAWSRAGDLLASGSDDGIVRLWRLQGGTFAPDGELRQGSGITALSWTWTSQNLLAIATKNRGVALVSVQP